MYAIDQQAARKADSTGSQIKEIGKYVGEFTQAVDIKTSRGGKGISFAFKALNGQKANLAVYTMGADGKKYQGYDQLMAIMTCMSLRNIEPKLGSFTRYDFDAGKEVTEQGSVFPELCKPIGILLETEDYEKKDGGVATRMVMRGVFQASTDLTASEIWDRKTSPEQLAKIVMALRHRPLKAAKTGAQQHAPQSGSVGGFADMDDEIPFVDPMKSRTFCLAI